MKTLFLAVLANLAVVVISTASVKTTSAAMPLSLTHPLAINSQDLIANVRDKPANQTPTAADTERSISTSDLNRIKEQISANIYSIEEDQNHTDTFTANNPKNGFRALFRRNGLTLNRSEDNENSLIPTTGVTLRTVAISSVLTRRIAPLRNKNRVEYKDRDYTEWFINDENGLEQGWTLHKPSQQRGERKLEIEVTDGGVAQERDSVIRIQDLHGKPRFRYAGLKAWDADQRKLRTSMRVDGKHRIVVTVDDRGARYPITVDPAVTAAQSALLLASDGTAGDGFGRSLAIDADTVIVGTAAKNAAYIFQRDKNGPGAWGQVAKLVGSDVVSGDNFGASVAVSGDTVIVSAHAKANFTGAAYVFSRDQNGPNAWGQIRKLTASDASRSASFSFSVALNGDVAVIGAPNEGSSSGAAYIFLRGQGGPDAWGQASKLKAQDAAQNDNFGSAVSAYGDLALIGARGKSTSAGAAYVFLRDQNGTGLWGQVRKLTATDVTAGDQFGVSVAIDGDTAVVGAARKNNLAGAAYLFGRDQGGASNWGQAAKLTASDSAAADAFGITVAIDGDTAIVGAENKDNAVGAAYVYARNQGGQAAWGQLRKIVGSDSEAGDRFGRFTGIDAGTIIIGSFGRSGSTGAAYALKMATPNIIKSYPLVSGLSGVYNIDGDVAIGTGFDNQLYILQRNQKALNSWEISKILSPDLINENFNRIGESIFYGSTYFAISGDTLAASTKLASYIFSRNQGGPNNWGRVKKIIGYGNVKAIDKDTILIGRSVFTRNQGGQNNWGFVVDLFSQQTDGNAAIDGDIIIANGAGANGSPVFSSGTFVFSRNEGGLNNWGVLRMIDISIDTTETGPNVWPAFGISIYGDTAAVTNINTCGDCRRSSYPGEVRIYSRNSGGVNAWGAVGESIVGTVTGFGQGVSLDSEFLLAGASSVYGCPDEGCSPRATVFARNSYNNYYKWIITGEIPPTPLIDHDGHTIAAGHVYSFEFDSATIDVDFKSITYPETSVNESKSRILKLKNLGNNTFIINDIHISGRDSDDFSVTRNECSSEVSPDITCTIHVAFQPSSSGSRSAILGITSDAGNSPLDIPLSGTGIAPEIIFSATAADFSNQPVNTTSAMQSITLTNSGNSVLVIGSVTTSGNFAQLNTCGSTLSAGSSCLINITFTPTASGARSGTLTVDSNAAWSPHTVALIGVGTAPTVQLFPSNLTFGSFTVGAAGTTQSITLTNTGNSALTVSFIGASGDFVVTPNCPISLSPGAACDVAVRFQPLVSGPRSGSVTVMTNAPSSPDVVNLSGTGIVAPPALSIGDVSTTEGNSGTRNLTLTIVLNPASNAPVNVTASTANGTAVSGSDFNGGSMSVSFAPGQTSKAVNVGIRGDLTVEADETFLVNLSNPTGGALLSDAQAVATIVNDDGAPLPSLSISDASIAEGNAGTRALSFTVQLSPASSAPVSVSYITASGTASAGSDFTSANGTLTFPAGITNRTIDVFINGDTAIEPNESFLVNLTNPTGAALAVSSGQGTIANDDLSVAPALSINDVSAIEGNSGNKNFVFTVTLSPAATVPVTVTATSTNGSAMNGSDYTGGVVAVSFAVGQTAKTISLPIKGDTAFEPNENFFVNLSNPTAGINILDGQGIGTIINDD